MQIKFSDLRFSHIFLINICSPYEFVDIHCQELAVVYEETNASPLRLGMDYICDNKNNLIMHDRYQLELFHPLFQDSQNKGRHPPD